MKRAAAIGLVTCLAIAMVAPAFAHAPSGAIFTTLADGSEVNFNIYPDKPSVYLDGGPGVGAPQDAAGLDDGDYVFQVTDPSGKTLLSTDKAKCRRFTVAAGVINGVIDVEAPDLDAGCQHVTGFDIDHGATTVQLMPYNDTPNRGGVYKVWVTLVEDYACNLEVIDCGTARGPDGHKHGFIPSHSKTDNFKVGDQDVREIDTRFWKPGHTAPVDGLGVAWTDTHGAKNAKWSYYAPELLVNHEAHVEAPEDGIHSITISDQVGCTVDHIHTPDGGVIIGPGTVEVRVGRTDRNRTWFIDVECKE